MEFLWVTTTESAKPEADPGIRSQGHLEELNHSSSSDSLYLN